MFYQIRMPIACFLIMIYCFWYYGQKKRLHTRTSKTFEKMALITIIHLMAAIVTEYTVNNRDTVSPLLNSVLHVIFFVSLICVCSLYAYYLLLYIERGTGKQQKAEKTLLFLAGLSGVIIECIVPIQYVDSVNGAYAWGMKVLVVYVVVVFDLIIMAAELFLYRNRIEKDQLIVLTASAAIFLIAAFVQYFLPYMLITGQALTMIMLGIMVNTENAHLYVSYKNGLCNELGCREMIQEKLLDGRSFQLGVYVFVGDDITIENAVVSMEKKFSKEYSGIVCGLLSDNILIILPLSRWSKTARLPEKLPVPDIKKDMLKYTSKIMEFGGKETIEYIEGVIRELKNRYEENILHKDELTGLLRREAFIRQVDALIVREEAFSFMMIDLDNFKMINDSYGHNVGDEVLQFVSKVFRQAVRTSDIICRMGGDEFAIVLCGAVDREKIREIVARMMENLESADILPDKDRKISISAGVTVYEPKNGKTSFEQLYTEADGVLYRTKYHGKNGVSFVEP